MFGMILLPLLLVLGLYLLFRERTAPQAQQSLDKACLHCGRLLQTDWTTCPYCGEKSDQE